MMRKVRTRGEKEIEMYTEEPWGKRMTTELDGTKRSQ